MHDPQHLTRSIHHRIPKVLIPDGVVRQCTSTAMVDGGFCDYQEFDNSADGNGLDIRTRNAFNVEIIEFWDEIFEIAERQGKGTSWNYIIVNSL